MSLLQEFYDKQKLKKAVSKIKDTSNSNELVSSFKDAMDLILEPRTKEVEILHDIKLLEERKISLQVEKELRIEEIDKQVADIDLILKTK